MDRTVSLPNESGTVRVGLPRRVRWLPTLLSLLLAGCSGVGSGGGLPVPLANNDGMRYQLEQANADLARLQQEQLLAQQQLVALQQQLSGNQEIQAIFEQRVKNLQDENARLHADLTSVIMQTSAERPTSRPAMGAGTAGAELSGELARQLVALATKYQGVQFVAAEKVCRFDSALSFIDQGDRLRPETIAALHELAEILNSKIAVNLNLLIVGHTSAKSRVITSELASQHPTDWHLAAHQTIAMQQKLEEFGLSPARVGIISYASQQPLREGSDDVANRANARVEIYMLAPDPAG